MEELTEIGRKPGRKSLGTKRSSIQPVRHVVQGRPAFLGANKRTSFNFSLDDIDYLKNRAEPNGSELIRRLLREHRIKIGDIK